MPSDVILGAYSAYTQKYNEAPADYDKIYVYADQNELAEIEKRTPKTKGNPNVFILKKDPYLKRAGVIASDAQTFVDLWNSKDWYAKDFLNKLKERIIG